MTVRRRILIAAIAGLASAELRAADLTSAPPPAFVQASNGWIVTLTGNVQVGPRYDGSDRLSVFGYPSIDFRRVGEPARFSAPDDGFSISVLDRPDFRFGAVARYRGGRYDGSEAKLYGLREVKWTIEPGAFLEYWPASWLRARVELRHGFHGHEGFVGDLALDWVQRYGRFTFSLGPRATFGDSDFTSAYFDVTPFEAAINRRVTPFRSDGGITAVGALGALTYTWSEQWSTTVYAGYNHLVGDAADSPITRRLGSPHQVTLGASLSYSFVYNP